MKGLRFFLGHTCEQKLPLGIPCALVGLFCFILILVGCSGFTSVKTTVEDPKGQIWTVRSKSDAHVKIKKDGTEVEVDNRGKLGFWEGIMQYLLVKPEVKIQNKGDGD